MSRSGDAISYSCCGGNASASVSYGRVPFCRLRYSPRSCGRTVAIQPPGSACAATKPSSSSCTRGGYTRRTCSVQFSGPGRLALHELWYRCVTFEALEALVPLKAVALLALTRHAREPRPRAASHAASSCVITHPSARLASVVLEALEESVVPLTERSCSSPASASRRDHPVTILFAMMSDGMDLSPSDAQYSASR